MTVIRTALVTGAGGFIGSHLVETLLARGCAVRAMVHYNSRGSRGWLDSLDKGAQARVEVFAGDVRDPNGVRTAVAGMDTVFHLAALIGIPYSYHSPDSYVDTNVRGTLNVLQACRDAGTRRLLVTSTSEVYGTAQRMPIEETHARRPQSPYSATKIGADCLAESFHRCFDLPVTIVRPFNTYGPRQSARAIIPAVIGQLLAGRNPIELGDLTPTRDLVFVKDTAEGFARLAESDAAIGADVNIATGAEIAIGDLARRLVDAIAPGTAITSTAERTRPDKSEVRRLCGANGRLRELTGWAPGVSLEQGLAGTVAWFREQGTAVDGARYAV